VAAFAGLDFDGDEGGLAGELVGHASSDPAEQEGVGVGVFFEAEAAAVFYGEGGFFEEEAFFGGGGEDSAGFGVFEDGEVVGSGVVAEDGELEAGLAGGF